MIQAEATPILYLDQSNVKESLNIFLNLICSSSDKLTSSAISLNNSSDLFCPRISLSLLADFFPSQEFNNLITLSLVSGAKVLYCIFYVPFTKTLTLNITIIQVIYEANRQKPKGWN